MQDLGHLETSVLLDLLSIHTTDYTRMLDENIRGEAFEKCQQTISLLQSTINSRLQTAVNTNISDPGLEFTTDIPNDPA